MKKYEKLQHKKKLTTSQIIGLSICGVIFLAATVVLCCFYWKYIFTENVLIIVISAVLMLAATVGFIFIRKKSA